jgi:hypothetical protein
MLLPEERKMMQSFQDSLMLMISTVNFMRRKIDELEENERKRPEPPEPPKSPFVTPQAGDVWQHNSICFIRHNHDTGCLERAYSNSTSPISGRMMHGQFGWVLLYRNNRPYGRGPHC